MSLPILVLTCGDYTGDQLQAVDRRVASASAWRFDEVRRAIRLPHVQFQYHSGILESMALQMDDCVNTASSMDP